MGSKALEKATMYAIRYTKTAGGIEKNFEIKKDAPQPPPLKDGETLVQVSCASLNPVDYKVSFVTSSALCPDELQPVQPQNLERSLRYTRY